MIPIIQFQQTEIISKPLWYFDGNNREGELRKVWKGLKEATGYGYDNNSTVWSNIFGDIISLSIHYTGKSFEINAWNFGGNVALGTIIQGSVSRDTETLTHENYNKLDELSRNWADGVVMCSSCGNKEQYQKIKRQCLFAGVYCNTCWGSTYQKKAANMTYD